MSQAITGFGLGEALQAEGLLPENCRKVELIAGIDDIVVIRYEVVVQASEMEKLARALVAASAEVKP